jgi:hypothetical protein
MKNLPPSTDEYWEHAEVYVRDMEKKPKHKHTFTEVSVREIKCNCGVGFFIGVGDKIKDGHLYHDDKFVI